LKRILAVVLIFSLFFSLFCFSLGSLSTKAATTTDTSEKWTIEKYENYLENMDTQTVIKQGVPKSDATEVVSEIKSDLLHFQNMSEANKQKFIDFLNHPDLSKLTVSDDDDNDQRTVPAKNLASVASSKSRDYSVQYTKNFSFLGSSVAKFRVSVDYRVTNGKVKKIIQSRAYMVQGWSVISSKTAYKKAWITSSNKAAVDATFEIKGKAYGSTVFQMSKRLKCEGDKNGKRTYAKYWNN
jgi:hypothetical protein